MKESFSLHTTIVIATLLHEQGPTGVQSHFNAFARFLAKSNRPVRVVTPFDAPKWCVWPVFALRRIVAPISQTASVWWYRHWHTVFLRWALRRVLREPGSVVVYAQCPLSACAALDARVSVEQKIVLVVHFNVSQADEWVEKNAIKRDGAYARSIRKLEERTLPQVDGLVFVSNFMRREVCKRMPMLTAVRSAVIPNWCEERARESPDTIHFDLINIGTLEPRKNQQFLLHVLAHAVALKRRYTLALVGDGPDRTMLTQLASELGIADQVKFLGYRKNAAQLIPRAHLYVHSATVENLPIALIEAFACAKSVLAPNVGGIADILTDGKEGIFWRTDDVPGAAAQLVRLLEDDEHRLALGARARERYETELNAPLIAERLYTFLCKTDGVQTKSNANSYAVNTDAAF